MGIQKQHNKETYLKYGVQECCYLPERLRALKSVNTVVIRYKGNFNFCFTC